jgi:hypothetical protein
LPHMAKMRMNDGMTRIDLYLTRKTLHQIISRVQMHLNQAL